MLEVSNLTWVDEDPALSPQPPLSCRLHLWHSWSRSVSTREGVVRPLRALPAVGVAEDLLPAGALRATRPGLRSLGNRAMLPWSPAPRGP